MFENIGLASETISNALIICVQSSEISSMELVSRLAGMICVAMSEISVTELVPKLGSPIKTV